MVHSRCVSEYSFGPESHSHIFIHFKEKMKLFQKIIYALESMFKAKL